MIYDIVSIVNNIHLKISKKDRSHVKYFYQNKIKLF